MAALRTYSSECNLDYKVPLHPKVPVFLSSYACLLGIARDPYFPISLSIPFCSPLGSLSWRLVPRRKDENPLSQGISKGHQEGRTKIP